MQLRISLVVLAYLSTPLIWPPDWYGAKLIMQPSPLPYYLVSLSLSLSLSHTHTHTHTHRGPNIFLSSPFSNTLGIRPFFKVSDQVSHPYKSPFTLLRTQFRNQSEGTHNVYTLANAWVHPRAIGKRIADPPLATCLQLLPRIPEKPSQSLSLQ